MFFWKYFGSYLLTDDHDNQHVYMKDKDVNESQSEPIFFTFFTTHCISSLVALRPPPRYKMGIITIPVISILLTTLVPQIYTLTEMLSIPFQLRLFIGITITVLLMT